ncbi:MAG: hypothetical protein OEZ02_02470 [Anaerolineae bacterium]|nr:hypothetical protein [Anaerolineae bacterium]
MKKYFVLILFVLMLGFIGACNMRSPQTELPTIAIPSLTATMNGSTPSSSPSPSLAPVATKWWVTPYTPPPTLDFKLQDQFFDLLKTNAGCELPCVLGIMPGETSDYDALSLLEKYGSNGSISYPYGKDGRVYGSIVMTKDALIKLRLDLFIESGTVQRILFKTMVTKEAALAVFDRHLERYSLQQIFLRHGPPDLIYFDPPGGLFGRAYSLRILYKNKKIMFSLPGGASKNAEGGYSVCPNIGDGDIAQMTFVLAHPSDPVDIREYNLMVFYDERDTEFLLENVTGMSIKSFYDLIINNQPGCFDYDYSANP